MHKTRLLKDCKRDLHFAPRDPWPTALPLFCQDSYLLCGFERKALDDTSTLVYELDTSLEEAFKALYPKLTLPELARLAVKVPHPEELCAQYKLKWTSDLNKNLTFLAGLSLQLQDWLSEKDISPRELDRMIPLTGKGIDASIRAMEFCFEKRFSKNHTLQTCEWIQELVHMDRDFQSVFEQFKNADDFMQKMKSLRFPQAAKNDSLKDSELKKISWPSKTEVKWVRHGDLAGLEIQIKAHSGHEIEKQMNTLQSLKPQLKNLWGFEP